MPRSTRRAPPTAVSRSWPRRRSVPSSSPRRTISSGAALTFSFRPFFTVCFSLIFSIIYHLPERRTEPQMRPCFIRFMPLYHCRKYPFCVATAFAEQFEVIRISHNENLFHAACSTKILVTGQIMCITCFSWKGSPLAGNPPIQLI